MVGLKAVHAGGQHLEVAVGDDIHGLQVLLEKEVALLGRVSGILGHAGGIEGLAELLVGAAPPLRCRGRTVGVLVVGRHLASSGEGSLEVKSFNVPGAWHLHVKLSHQMWGGFASEIEHQYTPGKGLKAGSSPRTKIENCYEQAMLEKYEPASMYCVSGCHRQSSVDTRPGQYSDELKIAADPTLEL